MSTEDIWAVAASFGEIFAVESPPTHSDMDVAFRRAGVLSPQSAPGSGIFSISKARRITNAFDQADEGKVDGLIRALTSSLVAKRVFEKTYDEVTQNLLDELRRNLARVGWGLSPAGSLSPLGVIDVQVGGREALEHQIKRLRNSGDDVSLILGAAKDSLEAGAKFVLEERQERYQPDESLEALLNRAMKLAGISTRPADVSSDASKALATINQSVPKIAEAVRKVRNDQGSGHGRTVMATMSMPEAAFIRDLTLSVVNFLLSEHDAHPRW
ncbi:abortive infection family protein [Brevibacterium spongiae]|uniref:Abortive infection family protein n=1 Tax=Brevibacterium spongiae TaxID=2909672 RepID=A0ABY5SU66_9MICO|nr:abortive infection family protein [Brevibacterium spongiae]UVI38047.1 abortive infection family protein [Brevibacterium spongiae]